MSLVRQWLLRSPPIKMASFTSILRVVLAALALNIVYGGVDHVPLPTIDRNEWWGPGQAIPNDDTSIKPFTIQFTDAMISDLKARIQNHRPFTPSLQGTTFEYGFYKDYLEQWGSFLVNQYPFKDRETFFNQNPHFKTKIQGLNIHFMRVTAPNATNLTPLLILHGHPGSFVEFYETIPFLISLGKAVNIFFDLIIASLPGYTCSDPAAKPGLGVDKVAVIMSNLMHRMGYSKYYIQGGDMGALVTNNMATLFPDEVMGYHTNFPMLHTPDMIGRLILGNFYHQEEIAPAEHLNRIYPSWDMFTNYTAFTGYLHEQSTKPDSFAMGCTDSPLGLMSHILITRGTPNNTGTVSAVQLLDNYVLYWSTNCENTAMRLYAETFNKRYVNLRINEIRSPVPTVVTETPKELIYLPEWMIRQKYPNLLYVTYPASGGHWYAWTMPQEYAQDVVNAVVAFKKWHAMNDTMYTSCSSYIHN